MQLQGMVLYRKANLSFPIVLKYVLSQCFLSFFQGRFRDLYMEIKGLIESEVLLSSKQLGVVCVIMIDSSPHAKARAQACHMCIPLLEKLGLAGMGKKGVLAAAKFLSQETTMHRVAALDLMEIILSKMSGDIQRLVRICGPNLSDKARILLEERWFKGQIKDAASPSIQNGSPLVRTQSGSPQKRPVTARFQNDRKRTDIFDELPRLSLRTGGRDLPKSPRNLSSILDNTDDRLAFTFLTRGSESDRSGDHANTSTSSEPEARGAAAALRARLLKIREKSKFPETGDMSFDETEMDGTTATEVDGSAASFVSQIDLNRQTEIIHKLLRQNGLVEAKDLDLEQCILSLKMFHAALSRQQHSKLGMSSSQLSDLRESLLENMSVIIDLLQRYIFHFLFHS